ncbi:hypothetical protein RJT34_24824 [Clitoria ternatea]|uniref:Uncharacterized protein n=1 Tax=Clitoria ternatea TaxID=43366 RepID=A0AAN9FNL3_CLITE
MADLAANPRAKFVTVMVSRCQFVTIRPKTYHNSPLRAIDRSRTQTLKTEGHDQCYEKLIRGELLDAAQRRCGGAMKAVTGQGNEEPERGGFCVKTVALRPWAEGLGQLEFPLTHTRSGVQAWPLTVRGGQDFSMAFFNRPLPPPLSAIFGECDSRSSCTNFRPRPSVVNSVTSVSKDIGWTESHIDPMLYLKNLYLCLTSVEPFNVITGAVFFLLVRVHYQPLTGSFQNSNFAPLGQKAKSRPFLMGLGPECGRSWVLAPPPIKETSGIHHFHSFLDIEVLSL